MISREGSCLVCSNLVQVAGDGIGQQKLVSQSLSLLSPLRGAARCLLTTTYDRTRWITINSAKSDHNSQANIFACAHEADNVDVNVLL